MNSGVRNIFVRFVLVLCAVMQMAVSMPHHHHDGASAACFDMSHCEDACGGCTEEHGHDCGHACSVSSDAVQAGGDDSYRSLLHCAGIVNDNFAVTEVLPCDMPCLCSLCLGEHWDNGPGDDVFVCYVRAAIPVRAPSRC